MRNIGITCCKQSRKEFANPTEENIIDSENINIIVNKKRWKKRKKYKVVEHTPQLTIIRFRLSQLTKSKQNDSITRHSSMPELNIYARRASTHPPRNKNRCENNIKQKKYKKSSFQSKFIANVVAEHRFDHCFSNPFNNPGQTKWNVYRCQLGTQSRDVCCCSCNSDAMFEVMKGLYDCYKAKNCDDCWCVLCSHKTKEERRLGEISKSMTSAAREKVLDGKTPEQKEEILKAMANKKVPLPAGKTESEKALIDKVRKELGLPPSPKTAAERAKLQKAEAAGMVIPLEGKTAAEKEKILRDLHEMGVPLPEARTASEKSIIAKIQAIPRAVSAKILGVMTPLSGKTPEEKEKALRARGMAGLPLPEGKTASEKKLIDKVRADLGLPKEPTTSSIRDKHEQAARAGLLQPLEGKSPAEKEKILQGLHDMGIPLPEGRTASEKALVAKVKAGPKAISAVLAPSEQMRRAKAAGFLTPLTGKSPEEKEKILKGLAMSGLPLPVGQTPSEKKLIDKVRDDLGLPPEPTTKSIRDKHSQAARAGFLQPLEGKSPAEKEKILKGLHEMGIPLPEGRTPSEKALIANIAASPRAPSIKTAGMMTPLAGKTPIQKEKILRKLAAKGVPLPEGQTPSEKKILDRVRADMGLPPEPTTKSLREKYDNAAKAGLLQPLEGKSPTEKEKILKDLHEMGIPLPEGRTPSEKALIANIAASPRAPSVKTAGMMTPLAGKTPIQKEKILRKLAAKGVPLPEGQTPSEKKILDRVRADMGLPPEPTTKSLREKYDNAAKAGLLQPLEGKSPAEKEKILKDLHEMGIPLPEGRTPSEKALIANIAASPRAPSVKTAGMMTPLAGKTPIQKEKILRKLAAKGVPLPEGQTPSEKKVIDRVRAEMGLPPEPTTKSLRDKYDNAAKAGLLQPLEGKSPAEKEKILKDLHEMGIPLPEGRTPSEKALIANIAASPRAPSVKTAGMMTPLAGKTPIQKEKILRKLAAKGVPLPEGQTPSEKKILDRVRADMGLPPEPTTKSLREKYDNAAKAGLLQPLEGKSPAEKEKILKDLHEMGIPLPVGRTPSEKALIANIAASPRAPSVKTAGMMTPLAGKTPIQKEKILRKLAAKGVPLPEGQTPSEKKILDRVRADMGLPPEPTTKSLREKYDNAAKAGLLQPLEGKSPAEKEKILKDLHEMGIPLPEGRTPSEKALIANIAASPRAPSVKTAGMMTPLAGKTPIQKEKILRKLAAKGMPLPEGQTPSEKKIIDRVRADMGLPPEPTTKSLRDKYDNAAKAGLLQPLEGKSPAEKEKILKDLHEMGIPLPEGRTPSEKALIANIAASPRAPSVKTAGMMTPLAGKTPIQKEKILRKLAAKGVPLPEGQTPSEKKILDRVRADMGLPPEPTTKSLREKYDNAAKAGLLQPLEGKSPAEKEKILKDLHEMGIPLPVGRTPSEKALIANIAASPRAPSVKTAGMMTPLAGKTPIQKEKILRKLVAKGVPLPEGQTPSEKKILDRVRADMGLPPEPTTKSLREKYDNAAKAGLLQPLEGKSPAEKEKILKDLHEMGIPLPEGRTPSEKALIANIAASPRAPSVKTAGMMTPLAGKTPIQKEKILRKLAAKGMPLPEGQTPSEKKVIDRVRADMGLPPEPTTKSLRDKYDNAAKAGLLQPLEGKSPAEKEKILKDLHEMGIPLPEGRTPSEKALIANIAASPRAPSVKTAGMMTPLAGKTPIQKEKILRKLAAKGMPLPEGQTPSEKKVIDRVRAEMGLPPEPTTKSLRDKYDNAAKAGLLQPLEGKSPAEKEKILKDLHEMGIPLPEGRTPSEKALIANIAASPRAPSVKTAGMMTPLAGKTPIQKEKILRKLAAKGVPLPEGQTPSEKKILDRVRADMGLPPEPTTKSLREKYDNAAKAGLLQPLEGKSPAEKEKILKDLHEMGIPLPVGRTPSEKALIANIAASPRAPSVKTAGMMTPLAGKTPIQKEKILRKLAAKGVPLPEGQTPSEKKILDRVRADMGLPPEPTTKSLREKYDNAAKAGLLQPLEGKSPEEKQKILKGLHEMGIPLPEGRTPSEKALIANIAASPRAPSVKTAGMMTPLAGKTPEHKEKILRKLAARGLPLPEGQTPSEKKIIDKVRDDLGLPPEPKTKSIRDKHSQAAKAGFLQPLEGKTPAEKEKILRGLHDLGIPLPEGRTPSEKALIANIAASPRAPSVKTAGMMTPLAGKTPIQKEKILRKLAAKGVPLPEGQTPSEKKVIDKVRAEMGLPPEPTTKSLRDKYDNAAKAGLLQPLEGKSPAEKEKILKDLHEMGIPLPEGRTPSEKALIANIAASPRAPSVKTAGMMTPLAGKTPIQKEKILRKLAAKGVPLPEGQTPSEKKIIDRVRAEMGLPPEPTTKSLRDKYENAAKAGLLQPLEGKTPAEKEKILQGLHSLGIPLPEGRTSSEKALIGKIKAGPRALSAVLAPSEQMRRAKAEGLLTPLAGKTPEQKENILKGLADRGLPLPEGQTLSEKKLIDKVRAELGLPPEPKTKSIRDKHDQAAKAGLLKPLEGKTPAEKEKILKGLYAMGIPLPEGRTPSEKALIDKVKATPLAEAMGAMTPLAGKTPEEKEKSLRSRALRGLPLPEGQTPSEKQIIEKVRADLGLPKEPTTKSIREKHEKAAAAGLLQPLEGKTPVEKEKTLRALHDMGIPLPEGRTPSEKALVAKIVASSRHPSKVASLLATPSEKMRKAKGLLTPLAGKTPEQKEKILKGLADKGLPLPEGQTASEKKLIDKVRAELGLPPEPKTKSIREKHDQAAKAGLLKPLEGKTPAEKEKILKDLHDMGIPLPEGRTPSEKALVEKVKAGVPKSISKAERAKDARASLPTITSEKIRKAKADGLFTPLTGKTPEQKEKILRGLATTGLPLPEGKTPSEKALVAKVKKDFGIPEKTPSEKMRKAKVSGLLTPLEGKSPEEKEKLLRGRAAAGLPLPMGKTPSERALIQKIKDQTGYVTPSPSERLRKAKAAGLITPLKGKTPSMKAKILQHMKAAGVPIPEGETPSEKKLISKLISARPSVQTPSEKLKAAKAAGLLTPLEGKTPAQKQKILEGLAEAGLPLPEGKTKSEKSMIAKIKARTPPPAVTPSEKSVVRKAKAAGLFTPITGKEPAEKERILKGLAEAGLPLPEGKTASEKELVKRIRAEAGLPLEPTPSEKQGKIRKKEKKVGISASKKAAGIEAEEFQDIIKTTKCDRGCGCDKKKIKFKHSYVKIRVTSPDISSLCDCPGECLPGVKSGAFIDNEGIKVTVGTAVGTPTYSMEFIEKVNLDETISNSDHIIMQISHNNLDDINQAKYRASGLDLDDNISIKADYILNTSSSGMSYSSSSSRNSSTVESLSRDESSDDKGPLRTKSGRSFETILVINSEMSLSTSTSNSMYSISSTSLTEISITSSSAHYSGFQSTNDLPSIYSLDGPTSDDFIDYPSIIGERNKFRIVRASTPHKYTVMRMSQLPVSYGYNKLEKIKMKSGTEDLSPRKLNIAKAMNIILAKKRFVDAAVVFLVVPMYGDEEERSSSRGSITSDMTANSSDEDPGVSCFRLPSVSIACASTSLPVCDVAKSFNLCASPVQCLHNARSQLKEITSLSTCVSPPEELKVTSDRSVKVQKPSIESLYHQNETAVKHTDMCTSWLCQPSKHIGSDHSQQNVTPTPLSQHGSGIAPVAFSRMDLKVMTNRSIKVQKPSMESICHEYDTGVNNSGVGLNIPLGGVFGARSKSHDFHHRSHLNQMPGLPPTCIFRTDDLCLTRNRSVKVQKPSIESLRVEDGTATEKLTNILENKKSIKMKQGKIELTQKCKCLFKEKNLEQSNVIPESDIQLLLGLQSLQKLASSKNAKQKEEEIICECKKDKPMILKLLKSPLSVPPDQHPEKVAEDVTPVPQKLASSKTTKQKEEDKPMIPNMLGPSLLPPYKQPEDITPEPQILANSQTDKQKDKLMEKNVEGRSSSNKKVRFHSNIIKSIFKMNATIKNKVSKQALSKLILQSLKSGKPKVEAVTGKIKGKQNEGDIICNCKKNKPSPKEIEAIVSKLSTQRRPPQLPPRLLGLPHEGGLYEGIGPSCQWIDTGEIKKLRSQLTRSTSGFRATKMKKQEQQTKSEEEIELDFGDAIRYFASMNPERFQQLMQEVLDRQWDADQKKFGDKIIKKQLEKEKRKIQFPAFLYALQRKANKKSGKGKVTEATATDHPKTYDSSEDSDEYSDETESSYPKGFKFSIVKDCHNAFAGLDCRDKTQQQFFKTKRHK